MRIFLATLAFVAALFSLGVFAISLLMAYEIHRTGQFHGMPFRLSDVIFRDGLTSVVLTALFAYLGFRLVRAQSRPKADTAEQ